MAEEIKVIMVPFGLHWNSAKRRRAARFQKAINKIIIEDGKYPFVYQYYNKPDPKKHG